jgi:hypothetical protein
MNAVHSSTRSNRYQRALRAEGRALALFTIILCLTGILGLTGCNGGFGGPSSFASGTKLFVNPPLATVASGSTTSFNAVFTPTDLAGGSLAWSVSPVNAGAISNAGVFTASSAAGQYAITATWTPAIRTATAVIISGSATVTILAVPQLGSALNENLVQASGANQSNDAILNGAIAGQGISSILSIDNNGDIQVRSGFLPPLACAGTTNLCQ